MHGFQVGKFSDSGTKLLGSVVQGNVGKVGGVEDLL